MSWDALVAAATASLPGVELSTSYGTPALKVAGKLLARLRPEDDSVVLLDVPFEEREMLLEADPAVFHMTEHYRDHPMVLARLDAIPPAQALHFVERRWRAVAPRRVRAAYEGASK